MPENVKSLNRFEGDPCAPEPRQQGSPIASAVVTCPAVFGLSSSARHSADSASIFEVSS